MKDRILYNLKAYLGNEATGKDTLLGIIIDKVVGLIKLYRNYPENYTEEIVNADLEKYEHKVFDICLAEFNRVGVEGEKAHSENNVSSTFTPNEKLFDFIIPIARVN